jgi:hypothetical protein
MSIIVLLLLFVRASLAAIDITDGSLGDWSSTELFATNGNNNYWYD